MTNTHSPDADEPSTLCEDCGEEGGNHSADCPTWGDGDEGR